MIRVTIFEDNKQLRETYEILLDATDEMVCAGAYEDVSKLKKNILATDPDVILMDIQMPGMNGIEALKICKVEFPHIPILMQTMFDDDEYIFAAICAGASGYILKGTSTEKIIEAITDVHAGGSPMSPSIARKMMLMFAQQANKPQAEIFNLSSREHEVLTQMVLGRSYKMIADHLHLSYETIHSHVKNIYNKLHVNTNTEAVAKAIKHKLV